MDTVGEWRIIIKDPHTVMSRDSYIAVVVYMIQQLSEVQFV